MATETRTAEYYAVFDGDNMVSGTLSKPPVNLVVRKIRATCRWDRERYEPRPGVISERLVPTMTYQVIEEIHP